jgi:hypothetical protein
MDIDRIRHLYRARGEFAGRPTAAGYIRSTGAGTVAHSGFYRQVWAIKGIHIARAPGFPRRLQGLLADAPLLLTSSRSPELRNSRYVRPPDERDRPHDPPGSTARNAIEYPNTPRPLDCR